MPKTIQVTDPAAASGIYALAATGFQGTVSDLTKKLGFGVLSPTDAGRFGSTLKDLAEQLEPLKVEIEFVRKGNNKYITIGKAKGYKKAVPQFARSEEIKPPKGAALGFDPTDARIIELNSEVVHLKSELNATRRAAAAATKDHGLFQAIVKELEPRIVAMKGLPPSKPVGLPTRDVIREHLVMHLSDGHHDQVISPHECQGLEDYNFFVSCRRAENYVDTTLRWTQSTLSNFKFENLTVLAYGDHTSGEIHGAVERSTFRNQFRNSLAIGQLHALMYRDLAPYFNNVNIVYVPGNHGRRTHKKEYHGAWNNWDYLVAETARMYCRDMENVNFVIPNCFAVNVEIDGVGFQIAHGDDIKTSMGIPWYGLERRSRRVSALNYASSSAARVRYFVCGHFHKPATVGDMDGELIINGPWPATDAYAYNCFSGFTEPQQLIHGVNEKYGVSWRLPVKLRTPDEKAGPKRYKIELSADEGLVKEYADAIN